MAYDPNKGYDPDAVSGATLEGGSLDIYEPSNVPNDKSTSSENDLVQEVISSEPYQVAYSIFAKLSDKSWLQQLEMIPYSTQYQDSRWYDFATSSDEDKRTAAYQYCMEKIENLLHEYRQYVQDLPLTQRQDLASAGIYGDDSIDGASISDPTQPNANQTSIQGQNPTWDIIKLGADVIFGATNGGLSWFKALADIENVGKQIALGQDNLAFNRELGFAQLGLNKENLTLAREQFANTVESSKSSQALQYWDMIVDFLQNGYNAPNPPSYIEDVVPRDDISNQFYSAGGQRDFYKSDTERRFNTHMHAATPAVTEESLAVMGTYNDFVFNMWKLSIKRDAAMAKRDKYIADYESGLAQGNAPSAEIQGKEMSRLNHQILYYNDKMVRQQHAYLDRMYQMAKGGNKFAGYVYGYSMTGYDINGAYVRERSMLNNINATNIGLVQGSLNTGINAFNAIGNGLGVANNFLTPRPTPIK